MGLLLFLFFFITTVADGAGKLVGHIELDGTVAGKATVGCRAPPFHDPMRKFLIVFGQQPMTRIKTQKRKNDQCGEEKMLHNLDTVA